MTLHEAILKVLNDSDRPMSGKEIVDVINRDKLYLRKDNNPVPSSQIYARVNRYPHLFFKNDNLISLIKNIDIIQSVKGQQESPDLLLAEVKNNLNRQFQSELIPYSLINLSTELRNNNKGDLQFISFVFLFRILNLIKEGLISEEIVDKDILGICQSLNLEDPSDITKSILYLNNRGYFKDIFNPLIKATGNQFSLDHNNIIQSICRYDLSYKTYDVSKFGAIFYDLIKSLLINKDKLGFQYSSPFIMLKIITGLIKDQIQDGKLIYDPAVGFGGFFIEINKSFPKEKFRALKYIGQEINYETAAVCRMNLIMNGIYDAEIYSGDSILSPFISSSSVDISVCEPPIRGSKIWDKSGLAQLDYIRIKSIDPSNLFIQHIGSRLKNEGLSVIILPEDFLSSSKNANLREALVKSDLIEYIVDLPSGFELYSKNRTCLVALRSNKSFYSRNKIALIKVEWTELLHLINPRNESTYAMYSEFAKEIIGSQNEENYFAVKEISVPNLIGKRIVVDNDRIERNKYILSTRTYLSPVTTLLTDSVNSEEKLFKLKDLIIDQQFKSISEKDIPDYSTIPFIRIKNLSDNFADIALKIENRPTLQSNIKPTGKLIGQSVILIAKNGEKIKPTWFDYNNKPIIISDNILPLVINTKIVLIEYLLYQLNSEIVLDQLELIKRGSPIPFFRRSDLFEIKIPVPPISEQINRVAEFKKQEQQKFRLTSFINSIKLIEDPDGIKNEIESFTKQYFPRSEQVLFRTELEFEKFPFTSEEIAIGKHITSSYDKLIKHMLIIGTDNIVHGVITVSEENDIGLEIYSTINAYANFLLKTIQFIRHSNASNILAKFAHSSKNFFVGLSLDIDSLVNAKNPELIKQLENLYIDRKDFIQRQIANGNSKPEDFLAINKIRSIRNKISKVASFYKKTSTIYKDIAENSPEEFDVVQLIKDSDFNNCAVLTLTEGSFLVYAKKPSIRQAFADLIQNAFQYSPNKTCYINITDKISYVNIELQNSINHDIFISSEKYKELGKTWLTKDTGDGASSGLYWAFQAVIDSLGQIELGKYEDYVKNSIFRIEIKLRKKL
jgi:type I restriction-modification system DNA methylase subunit